MTGLEDLFEGRAARPLSAGETLFRQGTPAREVFLLVSGRVRLLRLAGDGQTATMHTAEAGELFAEGALFSKVYHCDAVADVDTIIKAASTREMMRRLAGDPTLALALAQRLAHQLHRARALVELRNIRSAEQRVLQHLRLSVPIGGDTVEFQAPLMRIATELGLTHEAYYRVLAKLARSGLVERSGRRIRLARIAPARSTRRAQDRSRKRG